MERFTSYKGLNISILIVGLILINIFSICFEYLNINNKITFSILGIVYLLIFLNANYKNTNVVYIQLNTLEIVDLYIQKEYVINLSDIVEVKSNFLISNSPFCKKIAIKYLEKNVLNELNIIVDTKVYHRLMLFFPKK